MAEELPEIARRMLAHDRGRDPERLALKYARIRQSPFAFLRATAFAYYADCPLPPVLADSPQAWLSGDLHLENFGTYRGANGLVYFDVNDFDEASLAPLAWDIGRLLTSMLVAAHESPFASAAWTSAVERCLAAYAQALAGGKPLWIERRTARGPVRRLLRQLARRSPQALLKARTTGQGTRRRLRKDGVHALPASASDRRRVVDLLSAIGRREPATGRLRVLDVARRIAGTGSLGMERYVALVDGHAPRGEPLLLDLKSEVRPASLIAGGVAGPWRNDATRTVEVQRVAQAVPPAGLSAHRLGQRHLVLRELQPVEDRVDLSQLSSPDELSTFAADLGEVAAWAHLRGAGRWGAAPVEALMAFGSRRDWRMPLLRHARAARDRTVAEHATFAAVDPQALLGSATA